MTAVKKVWSFYWRQKLWVHGVLILVAGIAILVWAGVLSSQSKPASTPELAVLLGASAVLQISGGVTFGRVGHVDAGKARSSVRLLITLGVTIGRLRETLLSALRTGESGLIRDAAIRADEGMAALAMHVEDAISDWTDIHGEALASELEAKREQEQRSGSTAGGGS